MRQSGILMHISSLPGPDGIGSLGQEAYDFADYVQRAGMTVWQVLPMGPTGYGESPYQSTSVFAGNPLFISLDLLEQQGRVVFQTDDFYHVSPPSRKSESSAPAEPTVLPAFSE